MIGDNIVGAGSGMLSFIIATQNQMTNTNGWKFIGLTLAAGALGYIGKEVIVLGCKLVKKIFK